MTLGAYFFCLQQNTLKLLSFLMMSGSSLKKHSKGVQAQDTQVKIQFSLLHALGLSTTVEGNFGADSK